MFVTPKTRLIATLDSIANVTRPPGSSRTIQSKMSKGANGRPAAFHPRNETATSAAVSKAPAQAPCPERAKRVEGSGGRWDDDVMRSPRANCGHVRVDHRRQIQRDQLRHDQAADDGQAERTPCLSAR